jgi:predicted ribosomally synthesized peptide with nif11-like leader
MDGVPGPVKLSRKKEKKMIDQNLIEKAKKAASAEELIALAKEAGISMTEQKAADAFQKLHSAKGELADEELGNVSGGCNTGIGGGCEYFISRAGREGCEECCDNCAYAYQNHPFDPQYECGRLNGRARY